MGSWTVWDVGAEPSKVQDHWDTLLTLHEGQSEKEGCGQSGASHGPSSVAGAVGLNKGGKKPHIELAVSLGSTEAFQPEEGAPNTKQASCSYVLCTQLAIGPVVPWQAGENPSVLARHGEGR